MPFGPSATNNTWSNKATHGSWKWYQKHSPIVSSLKLCPTVHLDRARTSSNKSESDMDHSGIPTWPKVSTQFMAACCFFRFGFLHKVLGPRAMFFHRTCLWCMWDRPATKILTTWWRRCEWMERIRCHGNLRGRLPTGHPSTYNWFLWPLPRSWPLYLWIFGGFCWSWLLEIHVCVSNTKKWQQTRVSCTEV